LVEEVLVGKASIGVIAAAEKEKCSKRHVVTAVRIAKFLLNPRIPNRCIAVTVLKKWAGEEEMTDDLTRQGLMTEDLKAAEALIKILRY
jgi:hypothetical protein